MHWKNCSLMGGVYFRDVPVRREYTVHMWSGLWQGASDVKNYFVLIRIEFETLLQLVKTIKSNKRNELPSFNSCFLENLFMHISLLFLHQKSLYNIQVVHLLGDVPLTISTSSLQQKCEQIEEQNLNVQMHCKIVCALSKLEVLYHITEIIHIRYNFTNMTALKLRPTKPL